VIGGRPRPTVNRFNYPNSALEVDDRTGEGPGDSLD
jgi:hypothetical protein